MRLSQVFLVPASFFIAALVSLLAANLAVSTIETTSQDGVKDELFLQGHEWASVQADGLQVILSGVAPSEAARFRALAAAGKVVDSTRVIDNVTIPAAEAIKPPRFSIEILRNDAGISMIGLIPAATDREALNSDVNAIARDSHVTDLLETADYPMPANWDEALAFAVYALETLPRSKISMDAHKVAITALADSEDQKAKWARDLKRAAPRTALLSIDISAPRPVITPFTLRFLIDENGPRFDACSAHTTVGRARIVSAATEAGLTDAANCTIGLGVPSPDWPDAVETGIRAVSELGGGSITFSDADVTLVAPDTTSQATFDRIVGELENNLPDLYSLHSVLPAPVKIDGSGEGSGPPEFVATRSPEGMVQMRGRLTDETLRSATVSFARAKFGSGNVYPATRLDSELPSDWPTRVLAGLEALSFLSSGSVVVQPEVVDIRGVTGDPDASDTVSRILSEKLGASENFQINVDYQEELDPLLSLPSPEQCAANINAIMAKKKITFAPGSANIEASAADTIDEIAEIMKDCADVRMEIQGYTDSQGREEMNLALSQSRAQAVLNALLTRRILTTNLTAKGYGEADPIADNGSEEGREANRRIEFRLLDTSGRSDDNTGTDQEGSDGAGDADSTPDDGTPADADAENAGAAETDAGADSDEGDANPTDEDAAPDTDPLPDSGIDVHSPEADDTRPQPRPER
ncbi:OmpA-OmpF porin, OOP family [Aliiroseovarius sediminilitoris]|uniref:OmpA-OmpF porin, OOP family n=1 Tax=Aliiroseovarius sediminilitoris TaxID=1173584 RepID=A0A1I0N8X2_9RHOB|nr:OmpA family protein [Aliiroseovarius sediminilitoris]SEV97650.1 OmpA-OmpF porin, OOP family [Aliiroseovarius sediminilitoris]